jgi:hypothetical protein
MRGPECAACSGEQVCKDFANAGNGGNHWRYGSFEERAEARSAGWISAGAANFVRWNQLARALQLNLRMTVMRAPPMIRTRRKSSDFRRNSVQIAGLHASRQILPPGKRS